MSIAERAIAAYLAGDVAGVRAAYSLVSEVYCDPTRDTVGPAYCDSASVMMASADTIVTPMFDAMADAPTKGV